MWIHKEEDKRKFINCVAFSPNGEYIASGSFDGTVKIWRVRDGKLMQTFEAKKLVQSIAFTPDSALLAAASVLAVTIWKVQDGSIVWQWHVLAPKLSNPTTLAISHDGSLLAVGFSDGSIRIWQIQKLKKSSIGFRCYKEVIGQGVAYFIYDLMVSDVPGSALLVAECDENGNLVAKYHYDGGGLIIHELAHNCFWCGKDPIDRNLGLLSVLGVARNRMHQ